MAVHDLFFKRQRRLRGETPDVFVYDHIPRGLRVQLTQILGEAIGHPYSDKGGKVYDEISRILCREFHVYSLDSSAKNSQESIFLYINKENDLEMLLSAIECAFIQIERNCNRYKYADGADSLITPSEAVNELNARFLEHGVGYQYQSNQIIRVDSNILHNEAILPTLNLLREDVYSGANEEFLKAHEHYRQGRHKECLVDALKSFESTMKAICAQRCWTYSPSDTAKKLIEICLRENLIPSFLQSEFTSLSSMLESGIPTVRNKLGGHGQGATPVQVPAYIARYALNTTASCILLLAEANEALK